MTFEAVTNEAVEAALAKHFPEEVYETMASYVHPGTGQTKTLEYSLSGQFLEDEYVFDGVTYVVQWGDDLEPIVKSFDNRAAAIEFYNALDLSEPLPKDYPTTSSPLPGGIPGRIEHYPPVKWRVEGALGSHVLGESEDQAPSQSTED